MRRFIVSAATAIAALAATSPAAAQYYPVPQTGYQQPGYGYQQPGYGYGQPQGYGYGNQYAGQQGLIRSYLIRADQLRQRVERFDGRDRINEREAYRLRAAAVDLQNRTRAYVRDGLNNNERRDLDLRSARLEQALRYQARDDRGYNNGNGNGYGYGRDRDRDGQIDRNDPFVDSNRDGIDDRGGYGRDRDRDGQVDRNDPFVDSNRDGIDDRTGYRIPRR